MKATEALIARQELRHQDVAGTWHVVEEGERVPRDHFLVAVHPGMFFVDTDELVALQTLTNIDAEGNPRTVRDQRPAAKRARSAPAGPAKPRWQLEPPPHETNAGGCQRRPSTSRSGTRAHRRSRSACPRDRGEPFATSLEKAATAKRPAASSSAPKFEAGIGGPRFAG